MARGAASRDSSTIRSKMVVVVVIARTSISRCACRKERPKCSTTASLRIRN